MKRQLSALLVMATLAIAGGNAFGAVEVWTFTGNGNAGLGDAYDTTIASYKINGGYFHDPAGINWGLYSEIHANGSTAKTLLRWDVSALNGVAGIVASVTVRLHVISGEEPIGLYRVSDANSGWSEGQGPGYRSPPAYNIATTWKAKFQYAGWAGGYGAPTAVTDYDTPALATGSTAGLVGDWVSLSLGGDLDELISTWSSDSADSPGIGSFSTPNGDDTPNEGLWLYSSGDAVKFDSAQSAFSPELVVTVLVPDDLPGDYDGDGDVDAVDVDLLRANMGGDPATYDADSDGDVDEADMIYHVENLVELTDGSGRVGTRRGDFNLDGFVDGTDLALMKTAFGQPGMGYADGNANPDLFIDGTDLAILKTNFGFIAPTGGGVPEPMTLLVMAAAGLPLLLKRKRKSRA